MSYFDKQWADLSEAQQKAMKDQYGSRGAWRDAKARAQGHSSLDAKMAARDAARASASAPAPSPSPAPTPSPTPSQPQTFKNPVDTRDGRIEAPSWYRNSDGSTPSTMQPGMTKEKWEASQAATAAKKNAEQAREDARQNAIKAADNYLANHPNRGQGSIKDAEYDRILKEGGLNNHSYQQIKKAEAKERYEQAKEFRSERNEAFQQSRADIRNHVGASVYNLGSARDRFQRNYASNEGKSYLVDATSDKYDEEYDYSLDPNEGLAGKLLATGKDFSWADYNMHKNEGAKKHNYDYEPYGGYQNWYDNHSMYGKNGFSGSQNVMSQDEIAKRETERTYKRNEYLLSDEYMNKYGKYDFAQNYYQSNYGKDKYRAPGVTENSSNFRYYG